MLVIFLTILVLWVLYKKYTHVYNLWKSRGIPYVPGTFPFGSDRELSLLRKYPGYVITKMCKEREDLPYFGIYQMRIPVLVIKSPEIIRLVLAKEFSNFRDRIGVTVPKEDKLSQHLFALEGERWRALRVKLTPTFTSGKLKAMFPIFVSCSEALENLLLRNVENIAEVKDIVGRFTTDIICSCAFGLEVNSMANSEEEFRKMGKKMTTFSTKDKIRTIFIRMFPNILELIKMRFTSKTTEDFLINAITGVVEHREKNGIQRNDFIDLLMQLRNNNSLIDDMNANEKSVQPIDMTIDLMAAQCFVFFFAGFETSSSVQSFCLYELALHPDIQERLHNEIESKVAQFGKVTYEAIQEMTYLDMVVSETMRKYPTLIVLTRRCTKPFKMPAGHVIEKGDSLLIPVWSLHHDPANFPNPESFDPTRFSPENKHMIKPFTYLPFGEGPRNCIGMRFGLLQTKMGLITILRKYKVEPCEQTIIPLELEPTTLLTRTKHPILLRVTKRVH